MKNIILGFVGAIFLASCGSGDKDTLTAKKKELKELEGKISELSIKADKLEAEITKLDSTKQDYFVDVYVDTVVSTTFKNTVELQGVVESKNTVDISAEASGVIQSVSVIQGSRVRKGQVIATMDNSTYQSQISELRNALSLAQTTYERQASLFKQDIGTEIQVLQSKNRVDDISQKIKTAQTMALLKHDLTKVEI